MTDFQLQKLLRSYAGLTDAQLADLNHEAVKSDRSLEDVVTERKLVAAERLYEFVAREQNLPFIDLASFLIPPELLKDVPAELAHRLQTVPLYRVGNTLTVATARPDDIGTIDQLRHALGCEIATAVAAPNAIQEALLRHYGHSPDPGLDAAVVELEADEAVRFIEAEERSKSAEQLAGEAPVVRFVNTITEQALADRASDIHIEPDEDRFRIRVRIDGLMRSAGEFPLRLHVAVASRIKILAGMDISDRRRPQDGGFDIRRNGRSIDVRVSTFPTVHGENTVMRLLDKSLGSLRLSELGLTPDMAAALERVIRQPHGIVLVTGPTGSGKSTTLYSALTMLNSDERNIITLEDPVEYRLPLVRQCQVNPKAGITFASGLRSILRQDPDIIMVGEIRDAETAEIAFQAALTGHLVLSTLHTNDAAGALTRMLDMNVEPFLISSSVIAVLAQRLVRRICERCSARAETESAVLTRLGLPAGSVFTRGTGCPACAGRGYRGRMGIYELLTVTPEVRRMVMERRSSEEVKGQAVKEGMLTLRQDGLTKVHAGTTTPEEVLRVTADQT